MKSGEGVTLGARVMELCDDLAQWSETPHGLTCTYLSEAHRKVATRIRDLMQAAGLGPRIDDVGNVVGRYRSTNADAKTVIVGSHYDTVTNAGKYDGRLGIAAGLAVIEQLVREKVALPFHVDLMAFSEEEGVRFSAPYIGSSAVAGRFEPAFLDRRDAKGETLRQVLAAAGHDAANIVALARRKGDVAAYLEVHIEQGPVLIESDLPVGIVTSIAGNSRFGVTVEGVFGHAGTVPMEHRRDAAAAAAEIVLCVESRCRRPNLVGTVGLLTVPDGAINVVPGRCELALDIRSGDDPTRHAAVKDILAEIEHIAKRRKVAIKLTPLLDVAAVPCSPRLQEALAGSIERLGVPAFRLPSGAGHDAVMFSQLTDVAMLFVRCGNGGVSHSPLETITQSDADFAARVVVDALKHLN
jgi:N-carbamoyl-L-amino-acid hydrolase